MVFRINFNLSFSFMFRIIPYNGTKTETMSFFFFLVVFHFRDKYLSCYFLNLALSAYSVATAKFLRFVGNAMARI